MNIIISNKLTKETAQWVEKVRLNGGSVSKKTIAASNRFVKHAKANGYWDAIKRMNLMCGDNLAAALTPLKSVYGFELSERNGDHTASANLFVEGDYDESSGLTPTSAADKCFSTGFTNASVSMQNCHVFVYSSTYVPAATTYRFYNGWIDNPGTSSFTIISINGSIIFDSGDNTRDRITLTGYSGTQHGFLGGVATSASDRRIFRNGSQIGSTLTTGGTDTGPTITRTFYWGTISLWNTAGSENCYDHSHNHNNKGYSLGTAMTPEQVAKYYLGMEEFQRELGRANS